jgi:hypothetical protein
MHGPQAVDCRRLYAGTLLPAHQRLTSQPRLASTLTVSFARADQPEFCTFMHPAVWDDYGRDPTEWPSVADVRRYRQQVKAKVGVSPFHNNCNWQWPPQSH